MCDDKNGKSPKSDDENELSASDESEPEEAPSSAPFDPELDGEDDDDEEDQDKPTDKVAQDATQKSSPFSLRGGSSGFSSRSHSIFDCLDNMAKMTSSSLGQDNVIDGVFARPIAPPPSRKTSHPPSASPIPAKKRGVPDYMVNPDRWTHYSLEDAAETSDRGNSRVAHQYLASLLQKKDEPVNQDSYNSEEKIIFSKPNRVGKEQPGNKPEKEAKEKGMRLSHLEEEEDEEEDKKGALRKQSKDDIIIEKKLTGVEKGDGDDVTQEGFVALKKTHHKMYRKSTAESSHI